MTRERRLVVGGIVVDAEQRIMVARRTRPEPLRGCWEFPGGKVEPGEEPRDALVRELREELAIRVQVNAELENGDRFTDARHPGEGSAAQGRPDAAGTEGVGRDHDGSWPVDERFVLRVWFCSLVAGEPIPGDTHDAVRWLPVEELAQLVWAPADEPIARTLARK